jgi:glycosyltransferase involved in cell wall biosynthesis
MKVLIFAPDPKGHMIGLYVRHVAREALSRGWQLRLVTTERATRHPVFGPFREEFGERIPVSLMGDAPWPEGKSELRRPAIMLKRWGFYRDAYRQAARDIAPDVCFPVNLDEFDFALALRGSPFGRTPFTGFLMRRNFYCAEAGMKAPPPKLRDKVLRPLYHRMLGIPSLGGVLFLEESMRIHAERARCAGWRKVRYVPDIGYLNLREDDPDPRGQLGLPEGQFVLLAYGHLTGRKAVDVLVAALSDPACPPRTGLLLVGAQDDATKAVLAGPEAGHLRESGRLHERAGFASEDLEQKAFRACDAVWLGYRGWYGMSGVLVQAAAAGKPLIATDEGVVGWMVARHRIGEAIPAGDPARVVEALAKLAGDPALCREYGSNGLAMAPRHTPQAFGAAVCDAIASCVR